ncbi:MAG: hypothetical protein M1376_10840 [Planctomycetes bacterium]|nr:hypothetical protein [Planctomycetota bacterium]
MRVNGSCTCDRCGRAVSSPDLPADWIDLRIESRADGIGKRALLCGTCRTALLSWINPQWAKSTGGMVQETKVDVHAESLADTLVDPQRLEQLHHKEQAFRRGVAHAFGLAGDLVRAGVRAGDLDILTDLAMDWRYGARPDVHLPEDLITLWRRGERGITGIDARALGVTRSEP